jgi:hypothetical protein
MTPGSLSRATVSASMTPPRSRLRIALRDSRATSTRLAPRTVTRIRRRQTLELGLESRTMDSLGPPSSAPPRGESKSSLPMRRGKSTLLIKGRARSDERPSGVTSAAWRGTRAVMGRGLHPRLQFASGRAGCRSSLSVRCNRRGAGFGAGDLGLQWTWVSERPQRAVFDTERPAHANRSGHRHRDFLLALVLVLKSPHIARAERSVDGERSSCRSARRRRRCQRSPSSCPHRGLRSAAPAGRNVAGSSPARAPSSYPLRILQLINESPGRHRTSS